MPQAIQVLTTLEYLGPYATGAYFGLVLQVGVADADVAQDVQVTMTMEQLFEPWRWKSPSSTNWWPGIKLWMYPSAGDPKSATASKDDPIPVNISSYSLDASIRTKLEAACKEAIPNNLQWIDAAAAKGVSKADLNSKRYPWPAHLAQVALYPYPIPHLLNLSFLLKVVDPDFAVPKSGYAYFATVAFKANVGGAVKTYTPQVSTSSKLTAGGSRLTTNFDDPYLVTCTQPLTLFAPAASVLSTPVTAEVTDWQAHLVAGCADLFDLASRLIGPVRDECQQVTTTANCTALQKLVADSFEAYVTAFLTAERDIIAYGCQTGPDGSSLLTRLCALWVAEATPATNDKPARRTFAEQFPQAVTGQRARDGSDQLLFNDAWLLTLKQNSAFASNSLIPLFPVPPASAKRFDARAQIKKGDIVIYHSRLFTALRDVSSPSTPGTLGSAIDWSLLDSTVRIYDDRASVTYKTGDRVLLVETIYQALSGGTAAALGPPPSASWSQLKREPVVIDVAHLSDRLVGLEHLHLQLTQSDLLSQLLLAQWQTVGDAYEPANAPAGITHPLPKKDYTQLFQSFRNSSASNMAVLNVRGLLLQGNLQDSWGGITNQSKSRDELRVNIPTELDKRLNTLLNALPGGHVPGFAASLTAVVNSWAKKLQDVLVPYQIKTKTATKKTTTPAQPTRTTEGLSILLDQINAASSAGDDAQDNLRQMSGLCVLMRETTEKVWRCLNVANPVPTVTGLVDPIVVPVPQHTQHNLRRAILTYNNQPLMGESPAHRFGKDLVPTQAALQDRLLSFQHPAVTRHLDSDKIPQWKIPGLAFNRTYDFLIGRVSNAGALPPSFSDPKLGPAILSFDTVAKKNPLVSLSGVPYMRTVPVSDLRFGLTGGSVDKVALPPIPADVHPRCREAGMIPDDASRTQASPLLMLSAYSVANATHSFELPIYKPTTDMLTWDRWMAALDTSTSGTPSEIKKLRTQVWGRYHVRARQESSSNLISLDDPAVRHLTIKIEGVDGLQGAAGSDTKSWAPPLTKPDPTPPPNRVLTPAAPLKLTIKTWDLVPPDKIFDPDTWTLNLKPGVVARITLTPSMDSSDQALFAPGVGMRSSLKSYTFVVETASKDLPSSDELRDAFQLAVPTNSSQTSVDFLLTPKNAPNVRGADLQTQIWRWDGRPSSQYPFWEKTNPPNASLLSWELDTFATRLASDSTIRPMTRSNTKDGTVAFEAHDDRSTEPSATYYRASVTAYNRYGSLVPKDNRSVSTLNEFASVPGAWGGWTRGFVRANLPADYKPPKPAIKFIVPLTGSTNDYGSRNDSVAHTAGVLVVVQGPWYAIGGLAEDICAHITDSSALTDAEKVKEAGPDPILYAGQRKDLPTTYRDYDGLYPKKDPALLHGPVGHTFDSSDVNPLWVSSSFVLDPPLVEPGDIVAQEGTFARVQFARVIHQDGVLGNLKGDLTSDYTDAVWIQFLPGRFIPYKSNFDDLILEIKNGTATVKERTTGSPITLSHPLNSGVDGEHYLFALLLTQEVSDLLGRKGQERFMDVLLHPATSATDPSFTIASWSAPGLDDANVIGRIIVIQRQANSTDCIKKTRTCALLTADDLWKEMFPPAGLEDQDALSRIVSVSPPISVNPTISCAI